VSDTATKMPVTAVHPSGDKRFKLLEVTIKRHQFQAQALIEILHAAQELFGFLELDLLYFIARQLKLPPSKVYGVATFYNFFSLRPKGEHTCLLCTGTACYVKGANALLAAVERIAGIKAGETTADGKLSLVTARCLGACGNAPAVVLDGTVKGKETPESLVFDVKGWLPRGCARIE
jgi:bidirectional [NiFe] hydrogenase diaphorase subunit